MELVTDNKQSAIQKVVALNQSLDDLSKRIELFNDKPNESIDKEEEQTFVEIFVELKEGLISEQCLVEYILNDAGMVTASGCYAALMLALWSRRPDIVLPYITVAINLLLDAGIPPECHNMARDLFKAFSMYGRVQTTDFDSHKDEYLSVRFPNVWVAE